MNDPWGSFQNFMTGFKQMMSNPAEFVINRMGVPKEIANDPDAIIQQMMQEGKITQEQYNSARQAATRIQNNPLFGQLIK